MQSPEQGKILANTQLPLGRQLVSYNNETVLAYQITDKKTGQASFRMISRSMFVSPQGLPGCPPLIKLVERGTKINLCFCHLWVDANGMIYWRIGELTQDKTFEEITWKSYNQTPGVKTKTGGSQSSDFEQGLFEGSRRWVEFLEQKGYKLLFPGDEVVGNQLYHYRSNEPEMLTGAFTIPDAMLAEKFEESRLPAGPVIVQPKYDGKRNLVGKQKTANGSEIVSASRDRKRAKSQLPHIHQQCAVAFEVLEEVASQLKDPNGNRLYPDISSLWLDGELFSMGMDFQTIMSATQTSVNQNVRSKELDYMIYDLNDGGKLRQYDRLCVLARVFEDPRVKRLTSIKLSPWYLVEDKTTLSEYKKSFEAAKLEGAIVRNPNGMYVEKRTWDLMKLKTWQTEEWYVVGVEEATGTHAGCAKWILNSRRDGTGLTCKSCAIGGTIGNLESRRAQLQNAQIFMGAVATLEFFGKSKDGIPRFPGIIGFNRTDF
jgi:hypothetical protein